MRDEIRAVQALLEREAYVTDRAVATAVYLAMTLRKPLLIEGHPGVGKTEVAKVLARALGAPLIRLQCYEGLDASTALYEWNYPKQLLRIRLDEGSARPLEEREASIFGEAFLLKRPLLEAITQPDRSPVLLVDEVDRSDEEFEAFLLEVLSDYQVTIPEIGTVRATHAPHVVLTSNRARELSEALRRRCLYLWVDYPSLEKELRIVQAKVPGIGDQLAGEVAGFVQSLRGRRLAKSPGVAETLDWARALVALRADRLDEALVEETLGCFLKDEGDLRVVRGDLATRGVAEMMGAARRGGTPS
jgi:MoxR-like ATPase